MKDENQTARIRALNDRLRVSGSGGVILVTQGVLAFGLVFAAQARAQIARYDDFTPENDPHGEHDFGTIEERGNRIFWKVDYYDLDRVGSSPDPADVEKTVRVLTIMLAEEY